MIAFAFIDSGVGGIPYMNELLKKKPDASCIYVADTANFPYGPKSHEEVIECVLPLVEKIINRFEPRVIVVACNTISVNALEVLRSKFTSTKFVGTVPAIKLAAGLSKKRCIGLLATKATCENPYNQELKKNFGNDIGLKLLDGILDNKQINNVYDFLEKHEYIEDKNLFRGSKYNYRNYKYENKNNSKNGILSFRDFIKDKKCHKYKKINFNDYSDIYNKIPLSN